MGGSIAIAALAAAITVNGHAIMQKIKVAGVDQGQLVAVRAPPNNNPVQDVTSSDLICGAAGETSSQVITIPAGSAVAGAWAHSLGGPQGTTDADNPIAASHHGPAQVYLASVSGDPSTASQTGLEWFKIAANTVTPAGVWGVDAMRAAVDSNGFGWQEFTMPSCVAPGNYLMRVELIALHGASSQGGAQFYQSCAQIKVTGSGSFSPASTDLTKFPGGYSATDPGILVNIYDSSIYTTYQAPGPKPISCSGGSTGGSTGGASPSKATTTAAPTSSKTTTTAVLTSSKTTPPPTTLVTKTTSAASTTTQASTGGSVGQYGQCGGSGYSGPTVCASPYKCTASNQYYSQCL